jgi:uncharacterized membrane protein
MYPRKMIREELFHSFAVHFPIALLSLTPFLFLGQFIKNEKIKQVSDILFKSFLYLGLVFFLVALFLGDLSLEIVKKDLPRLQEAFNHEDYSYYTLYIFLLVLLLDIFSARVKNLKYLIFVASIIGVYFLLRTGHSGADLVYNQGAAVLRN